MEHKTIIQKLKMSLYELEVYHRKRRKYKFEQGTKLKYISLRKLFYPVFSMFLTLDRMFRKQTVSVISAHKKYNENVIFACTHIAENDLEIFTKYCTTAVGGLWEIHVSFIKIFQVSYSI